MTIDGKAIADVLGYKPAEGDEVTTEAVIKHLQDKFIAIDKVPDREDLFEGVINRVYGKRMKEAEVKLVADAKAAGLDVTHSEFKDMTISDVMGKINGKWKEKLDKAGSSDDEQVKKLTSDLERRNRENEELRTNLQTKVKEFDTFKEGVNRSAQKNKIEKATNTAFDSIKYAAGVTEISKRGLRSKFMETYNLAALEDGTVELRDKNDNRVPDPKNMSEYLTIEDAVHTMAKTEKLWEDKKHVGGERSDKKRRPQVDQQQQQDEVKRQSPFKKSRF